MQRLTMVLRGIVLPLACAGAFAAGPAHGENRPSVPYVPTPQAVVDRMLAMGRVTAQDYLIDLGSGDGRIVVAAAKKFGARDFGVGFDAGSVSKAEKDGVPPLRCIKHDS